MAVSGIRTAEGKGILHFQGAQRIYPHPRRLLVLGRRQ